MTIPFFIKQETLKKIKHFSFHKKIKISERLPSTANILPKEFAKVEN